MTRLAGRPGAISYGHDIGILMIDCFNPFVPGDVGNAYTYDYPVLYHKVPEVTIQRLVEEGDLTLRSNIIEAARFLEAQGVKAITSDCGYMLHFQEMVRESVNIPVMLSSLLQLPFISSILAPSQAIGIVCANAQSLTEEMLTKAFPARDRTIFVNGMENQPEFRSAILKEEGSIDPELVERELVEAGCELVQKNPAIGAVLLECSNLSPYAKALQERIRLPVFDFTTMIDYVRAACQHRRFEGGY
ncbi:aspartate/glutamate racemase family protein [Mesorhizobium sp. 1M-11]|uniref:aspartate/glutamate racemase family protein n=1 Tax=Mesorhizobium sp. 1M-11 TaxID=1529006 RepID=UPI0006C74C65|nr:aspartate/glutamate racemase family protein [Mesorhizobium sp. 1M-11]